MKSLIFIIFVFFSIIIYSSFNKPDYSNPAIPNRYEIYKQAVQQMDNIAKDAGLPDSVEKLNRPTAVYITYIYNEYDDELIDRIDFAMSNRKWVKIERDSTEYQNFLAVYCQNGFRVDVFTMPDQSKLNMSLNWDGWVKICEKSLD